MSIRKLAAISLLVFSTIAATDVAPSNAELEAMYDKAFRAFDSADYTGALKELDAIDARKPDLAASQNLRGVIFMRQGAYDKAEAALSEALRLDPKFWNARFNLAEIPFLKKDWPEARKRFQELLSSNTSDLEGEATQLIQYKILLTYLLEQNDSMVASMLAKLQRSPDTPAAHYANAAIALQHKKTDEARNWMQAAEKNFSPQLNKLFAESLFEVGWIQQQPGQQRTALQLVTPEEHETGSKATAQSQLEQAQQAYEQRDFDKAATLAQQADTAQPNQPAILNLRGEILLEQGKYTEAEEFFTKALKIDSKFREAQFNLADVPFRQKDYGKARDRFQSLLKEIPGGDKNQASQLINFKIYMSYLLDGKESRAQKLMEQFQFSGDTPALYYAQAAWEFKHNNADKANDWIASARKIYPLSANAAYSTGFYNLGWLKGGATSASSPAPSAAGNAAAVASAQNESPAPSAIEPSPIPGAEAKGDENAFVSLQPNTTPAASPVSTAETKPSASPPVTAKEAEKTALAANAPASGSPAGQDFAPAPSAAVSPVVETSPVSAPASVQASAPPVSASAAAPPPVPSAARAVAQSTPATAPSASAAPKTQPAPSSAPAVASTEPVNLSETSTPPPVLSPARAPQFVQPSFGDRLDRLTDWRTLIWIPLLILGLALLAWVGIREFRGRVHPPHLGRRAAPAGGPNLHAPPEANKSATGKGAQRFSGGPRQVSVQLKASEPARPGVQVPAAEPAGEAPEAVSEAEAVSQPAIAEEQREDAGDLRDEELVGPVIEQDTAVPASTEAVGETSAAEPMLGSLQAGPQPLETAAALAANVTSRFAETDESVGPVMEQEPAAAGDIASETREEPAGVSDIPEQSSTAAAEPVDQPVLGTLRASEEVTPEPSFVEMPKAETEEPPVTFTEPESPQIAAAESLSETQVPAADTAPPELSGPVESTAEADRKEIAAPIVSEEIPSHKIEPAALEAEPEPVAQGQPVPYQTPAGQVEPEEKTTSPLTTESEMVAVSAAIAGLGALHGVMSTADGEAEHEEEFSSQPTHIHTMPETVQTPPAPVIRTPAGAPQPAPATAPHAAAGGMHTAVHITLSCEIASMQLTPTFKMGALQLRPISKVVTMRLAGSQQQQNGMNVQLNFEIAKVQPAPGSLGQVRLTPSQQQKPASLNTPSFNISALQVVSGFEQAPLQLTPSQQGQASVLLTAAFQITTVEFSPTFDIAAMILNSSSKTVAVQLPGAGGSGDGPLFEVTNVQLASNGEIGMLQLNPAATRRS